MKISEINKEQFDKLQREFEDLEFRNYEKEIDYQYRDFMIETYEDKENEA